MGVYELTRFCRRVSLPPYAEWMWPFCMAASAEQSGWWRRLRIRNQRPHDRLPLSLQCEGWAGICYLYQNRHGSCSETPWTSQSLWKPSETNQQRQNLSEALISNRIQNAAKMLGDVLFFLGFLMYFVGFLGV